MKKLELMKLAASGYPDEMLTHYFNKRGECKRFKSGDTLAYAIASKLSETFDDTLTDDEQLVEALKVMNTFTEDINGVCSSFYSALEKVRG